MFVDDRAELYGADHFRDLVAARNARPQWSEVFEAHGITQALVSVDDGIVVVLELSGWRRVTEGGVLCVTGRGFLTGGATDPVSRSERKEPPVRGRGVL